MRGPAVLLAGFLAASSAAVTFGQDSRAPEKPASAAEPAAPGAFSASGEVLDRLSAALAGDWETTTAKGKTLRVEWRPVSGGTALLETFGAGSGRETLTVFHADGTRLLATHYCAQGNVPRLRFTGGDRKKRFEFDFLDATNLADESRSHLVRLVLEILSPSSYRQTEVYSESGKADSTELVFRKHD